MRLIRKLYSAVSAIVVAAVVILAILLVGIRLVGLQPYTVLSGSMEPSYHVGSLIYVRKTDPMALQVGDPVTFHINNGAVATHRVIEVVEDPTLGRCYRTQGDANNIADSQLLRPENVIGKPVFTIPYLGYVSVYVQNPPGTYVAVATCLLFFAMSILTDVIFPPEQKEKTENPSIEST